MRIALARSSDTTLVDLEGEIDISIAAELKAALLEAIAAGKAIQVSTDRVAELDVTAFQLLWALAMRAKQAGIGFSMGELRGAVRDSLSAVGLDPGTLSA